MPVARPRRLIQQAGSFFVDTAPEPVYTNLLTDPNDHSTANWYGEGIGSITGGQSDRNSGSTAELFVESSATSQHSFVQGSITVTSGRVVSVAYYKQSAGSNSARNFQIIIESNAGPGASGTYVYADKDGVVIGSGAWGSGFSVNSATVTSAGNGYYKMTLDIQMNVTSLRAWIGSVSGGGSSYTGDGTSGWYIDDHTLYQP